MDPASTPQRRLRGASPPPDPLMMVRRRLLRQAAVFEDPTAYAAGVEDALAAVRDLVSRHDTYEAAIPIAAPRSSTIRGAVG